MGDANQWKDESSNESSESETNDPLANFSMLVGELKVLLSDLLFVQKELLLVGVRGLALKAMVLALTLIFAAGLLVSASFKLLDSLSGFLMQAVDFSLPLANLFSAASILVIFALALYFVKRRLDNSLSKKLKNRYQHDWAKKQPSSH